MIDYFTKDLYCDRCDYYTEVSGYDRLVDEEFECRVCEESRKIRDPICIEEIVELVNSIANHVNLPKE